MGMILLRKYIVFSSTGNALVLMMILYQQDVSELVQSDAGCCETHAVVV